MQSSSRYATLTIAVLVFGLLVFWASQPSGFGPSRDSDSEGGRADTRSTDPHTLRSGTDAERDLPRRRAGGSASERRKVVD